MFHLRILSQLDVFRPSHEGRGLERPHGPRSILLLIISQLVAGYKTSVKKKKKLKKIQKKEHEILIFEGLVPADTRLFVWKHGRDESVVVKIIADSFLCPSVDSR